MGHLCISRTGAGKPYSADEYISTLIRRDWEKYQEQLRVLVGQTCQHCRRPTSWLATPCDTDPLDHSPALFTKTRFDGAYHYRSLAVFLQWKR